jgi:spoIIIJ-associated protein
MTREIVKEAPTVAEAIDAALEELGVQQDVVGYEILEEPGRRMFGSDKQAKVRVWLKEEFAREIESRRESLEDSTEGDEGADDREEPARGVEDDEYDEDEGSEDDEDEEDEPGRAEERDGNDRGAGHDEWDGSGRDDYYVESEEELDKMADAAIETIEEFLTRLSLEARIDEYEGEDGELILDVVGSDLGILIGRHGKTLDALQALISAISHRKVGHRHPLVVDVEGYRARRREKLEDMAVRAAKRAHEQGREIRMRPMNSYERRVVHVALREDDRVSTQSEGSDPDRRVVISPR